MRQPDAAEVSGAILFPCKERGGRALSTPTAGAPGAAGVAPIPTPRTKTLDSSKNICYSVSIVCEIVRKIARAYLNGAYNTVEIGTYSHILPSLTPPLSGFRLVSIFEKKISIYKGGVQ